MLVAWLGMLLAGCGGGQDGSPVAGGPGDSSASAGADTRDIIPSLVLSGSTKGLILQAATEPGIDAGPARALRSRGVKLDLAALAQANPSGPRRPDTRGLLQIAFFDDAVTTVQITSVDPTASGGLAYVGIVRGDPNSSAVLVNNDGVVSMRVSSSSGSFDLIGDGERGYLARQFRTGMAPRHPQEPSAIDAPPLDLSKKALARGQALPPPDDGSVIDVMVVYTPAATARFGAGSKTQMNTIIEATVAQTNAFYANSGVIQRLRLVYRGEINVVERDLVTDLSGLATQGDGFADEVHYLRDLYRGDIVTLWGSYRSDGFSGYGFLMLNESSGFESTAFNIVAGMDYAILYAHELGHNMGLNHDVLIEPRNTFVTPEGSTTRTEIGYAHGYVDTANRFFTIMAYPTDCLNRGFNCFPTPHFSNPGVNYDNRSFFPSATAAPTGNASFANEARALNDTRDTVANFRKGLASLTGPGILSVSAVETSIIEGGGSVQLTVTRHVGSTGAVSVQYETVNGSASAALRDYTAVSGTLRWEAGDDSPRTITIPILQDSLAEGNEDFLVSLSAPTGGAAVGNAGGLTQQARVFIMDDDPDGFPAGCALPATWQAPSIGGIPWAAVGDDFISGPCSLKSGTVAGQASGVVDSRISSVVNLRAGVIRFNRKVAIRDDADCFYFTVFNNTTGSAQRLDSNCAFSKLSDLRYDMPWTAQTLTITEPGPYTIVIGFQHMPGTGAAAWIDSLSLPMDTASAPALTAVNRGIFGGTVSVSFNRPADASVAQVSSHTATCSAPGQATRTAQAVDSPIIVTGLTGGVSYTCSVAAVNAGGTGPSSAPSSPVIPRAAGSGLLADFNADNRTDLVWQSTSTGERVIWFLNGSSYAGAVSLGTVPVAWDIAASGDFNNDGKPDLLWQNTTTGERTVWLMDGSSLIGGLGLSTVPIAWQIAAVGDFNGDGKSDIVWQNTSTGDRALWFLDGVRFLGGAGLGTVPLVWQIAGAGDFNGDGRTDLLWQNTSTGERVVWFLNNASLVGSATLTTVPVAWQIAGTSDFNGDGKIDLVWQNSTTGERVVWFLNGTTLTGATSLGVVPTPWRIAR